MVGSLGTSGTFAFSTGVVKILDDADVTKRFFRSSEALSICVERTGGDDAVLVRVMAIVCKLACSFVVVGFDNEHLNISRNCRRNNDDVAE